MNTHKRRHKQKSLQRQAGVTLLLAILILSSIMAISFSLATVLLVETRSSGDLLRTEPALYGANAVTEEALFNVKRSAGLSSYSNIIGNLNISSQTSQLNDPVQQVVVPPSSSSFSNSNNVYLFYDPSNAYAGSGYGEVRVRFLDTAVSGAQLHIYLCDFDPLSTDDNCTSLTEPDGTTPNHTLIYRDSTPLNPGDCFPSCSSTYTFNFSNTHQQQLVLFGSGGSAANLYANIETFDTSGIAKGLPYFGKTAVAISAGAAGVARNLRVVIPNPGTSNAPACGPGNAACFVRADTATLGSWHGTYGTGGYYYVIGGTQNYPPYVTVTPSGTSFYLWDPSPADVRALYTDNVSTSRVAATWYNGVSEQLDFNFNDGQPHQVAIYALDFDNIGRAMTIDVLDGDNPSTVLDSHAVSSYNGGVYYVWNLSGHVIIRFTNTAGANAVISGIFFN